MAEFKLQEVFRHRSAFTRVSDRGSALANDSLRIASTCSCLLTPLSICASIQPSSTTNASEIYRNQTDGGIYGSLLWLLDHTKTKMGRRLMREWIGRPLLDVR